MLNLTHADFDCFHEQERSYLDGLKEPPLKDHISVQYIQALDEVAVRQYVISHPYQFHAVMHDMGIMHSHYPLSNSTHRKSHKHF